MSDEGSFKLTVEADAAFTLTTLPGKGGKKGEGRRRVEGKSTNQSIVPNGLFGSVGEALQNGAKRVAEAACPVQ